MSLPASPDEPFETGDEGEPEVSLDDFPTLKAVAQFTQMLPGLPWFHQAGEAVNSMDRCLAVDYLAGMGFTGSRIAYLRNWEELAEIAPQLDEGSDWWQEENRLFDTLITEALMQMEESDLQLAFAHIARTVTEVLPEHFESVSIQSGYYADDILRDIALGLAVRNCQMAASVLAAGAVDEEHPFATKFRLYEIGHWPIGIVGGSFFVF